jgi:NAD(P)-dependent dehydrogenase (short-subunit alcohol dehydrogenase family)
VGQLDGGIAIVTGSDSGIGQGIAEELAREGADVAMTYLYDEAARRSRLRRDLARPERLERRGDRASRGRAGRAPARRTWRCGRSC